MSTGRTRRRLPSPVVLLAAAWLGGLIVLAVFADYLNFIRLPDAKVRVDGRIQSNFRLGPGNDAWFGVDAISNDVFAQCIYYARNTLFIGFASTTLGLAIGGTLGILAGYFKGWVDRTVSIVIDCLQSIPALVLAIVIVSRLDDLKEDFTWLGWMSRRWQIIATLSVLAIAPLARIVRAQTLGLRERDFVLAARSLGANHARVITREILPNLVPTMVTVSFTGLGILIAAEGALAFVGLGLQESWGSMIETNRSRLEKAWWATIFPSLMLLCTVMAVNLLGDRLARRFDIREASV
jgi:peptide/nickel transport system permease protein